MTHWLTGFFLCAAGFVLAFLPASLVRHEQWQYAAVTSPATGRRVTRTLLVMLGATLMMAGLRLAWT